MSRIKAHFRTASVAAFQQFALEHPDIPISRDTYAAILYSFNRKILKSVMENGHRFKLPRGMGELSVAKYRPTRYKTFLDKKQQTVTISGLPINWKASKTQGKLIYHLNAHTDGYRYRWKWFSAAARFDFCRCFTFRPCRSASRSLGSYLKKDPKYGQIYREWTEK